MNRGLPLPHFESEGLENGYCQHHEGGTDDSRRDRFFTSLFHTKYKSSIFPFNNQTIRHISAFYPSIYHKTMQNIPDIWRGWQYTVPLQTSLRERAAPRPLGDEGDACLSKNSNELYYTRLAPSLQRQTDE